MNVQNYIDSGAIEAYVLGLMNAEEAAEMRRLIEADESVRQAVYDVSDALEQRLIGNAATPPPHLEKAIRTRLLNESLLATGNAASEEDDDDELPGERTADTNSPYPALRALGKRRSPQWLRYASSLLLLMLLASLWANVVWYRKHTQVQAQYQNLLANNAAMVTNSQTMQVKLQQMQQQMEALADPATQPIPLVGQAGYEQQQATVYMNYRNRKLMVLQNNLPALPKNQVYQLWAMVNGKPVSAGLLNNCADKLCMMKPILGNVQAYAISIEPAGPEQASPRGVVSHLGKVI